MRLYFALLLIFLMGCTTPLKKWDKVVEDPHRLMERQRQDLELIKNKDGDYEIVEKTKAY